jgi:hypothetical protein
LRIGLRVWPEILSSAHDWPIILDAMQSSSQAAASSTPESSTFAGFLSALASPAPASRNGLWNNDALADDVTTLSYESALKAHSRYRPELDPLPPPAPAFVSDCAPPDSGSSFSIAAGNPHPAAVRPGDLKSASITIRMSEAECAQLKQRAAEAEMTISAYLRSCTFEAEALRGQVKEALAQLRAAAAANDKPAAPAVAQHKKFDWLSRILPRGAAQNLRSTD